LRSLTEQVPREPLTVFAYLPNPLLLAGAFL
jgi:hypothetical protein